MTVAIRGWVKLQDIIYHTKERLKKVELYENVFTEARMPDVKRNHNTTLMSSSPCRRHYIRPHLAKKFVCFNESSVK